MNITIESLLADAKYLVNRLKDHDSAAESLAEQASVLKKEMEARNTYQENLIELNKVAGHRPRSTLVLGIQQENCAIRSLQQENDELRQSLVDHQDALELIMTKYRQQMMQFTKHQSLPIASADKVGEKQYRKQNAELVEKICEMATVMRRAADMDDQEFYKDYEELSRLQTENQLLREMLMISRSNKGAGLIGNTTDKPAESRPDEDSQAESDNRSDGAAGLFAGDSETIKRNPEKSAKKVPALPENGIENEIPADDNISSDMDHTLINSDDSS